MQIKNVMNVRAAAKRNWIDANRAGGGGRGANVRRRLQAELRVGGELETGVVHITTTGIEENGIAVIISSIQSSCSQDGLANRNAEGAVGANWRRAVIRGSDSDDVSADTSVCATKCAGCSIESDTRREIGDGVTQS